MTFGKFLDELRDTMLERYGSVEDVRQTFEELKLNIGIDPRRFIAEIDEYIKNKLFN